MNEVVKRESTDIVSSMENFTLLLDHSAQLLKSGILPDSLKSPQAVAAVILTGMEMGLEPMYALRTIHIIKGRPTLAAEAMRAMFRRMGGQIKWGESTSKSCTIHLKHPKDEHWHTEVYTIEMAQHAGLTGKDNWKKSPVEMLKARVSTNSVRAVAPELQMGCYIADEIEHLEVVESKSAVEEIIETRKASTKHAPTKAKPKPAKEEPEMTVISEVVGDPIVDEAPFDLDASNPVTDDESQPEPIPEETKDTGEVANEESVDALMKQAENLSLTAAVYGECKKLYGHSLPYNLTAAQVADMNDWLDDHAMGKSKPGGNKKLAL